MHRLHSHEGVRDDVIRNDDMIAVQVDALGRILDVIPDDAGEVAHVRSRDNDSRALLPVVGVAGLPGLLTDDPAFFGILFHVVAKSMLRLDLRGRDEIFLNNAIPLDESAGAVAHADAGAIGAVEGVAPVLALRAVVDRDTHVVAHQAVTDAAVARLPNRDRPGAAAVVEDADIFDDKVTALDRDDGFAVGLHLAFGTGQGEVEDFGNIGILDFEVRMIRIGLNEAAGAEKADSFPADPQLFREEIVSAGTKRMRFGFASSAAWIES